MPIIRPATPSDLRVIVDLLGDSAEAQGDRPALCVDEADLLRDAFSPAPRVRLLVAEADREIVGIAVYTFTYSTWTSINGIYMEDLYVVPAWRHHGVARDLVARLAVIAQETGCRRFQWQVLLTNTAAIKFYESLGAHIEAGWAPMQLEPEKVAQLAGLAARSSP